MLLGATTGLLALAGRVLGLGLERPLIKALGQQRDSIAATTLYFGVGELLLLPLIAWQWLNHHTTPRPAPMDRLGLLVWRDLRRRLHTYVWGMSIGEVSLLTPCTRRCLSGST